MSLETGSPTEYKETVNALNTITRMVIDIAYAFNLECSYVNLENLTPATVHIVRCAQQHILMADDTSNPQWQEDFEQFRRMLIFINKRWLIAG